MSGTSLDGDAKLNFSVPASSGSSFTFKPPEYLCPVHGNTKDGCVSLWTDGKLDGEYCMTCYKELIRKFCSPVIRCPAP